MGGKIESVRGTKEDEEIKSWRGRENLTDNRPHEPPMGGELPERA